MENIKAKLREWLQRMLDRITDFFKRNKRETRIAAGGFLAGVLFVVLVTRTTITEVITWTLTTILSAASVVVVVALAIAIFTTIKNTNTNTEKKQAKRN